MKLCEIGPAVALNDGDIIEFVDLSRPGHSIMRGRVVGAYIRSDRGNGPSNRELLVRALGYDQTGARDIPAAWKALTWFKPGCGYWPDTGTYEGLRDQLRIMQHCIDLWASDTPVQPPPAQELADWLVQSAARSGWAATT